MILPMPLDDQRAMAERLRRAAHARDTKERALIGEAADAIAPLVAEVARLQAENERLRERLSAFADEAKLGGWTTHKKTLDSVAETLRAEYPEAYRACFPPMASPG